MISVRKFFPFALLVALLASAPASAQFPFGNRQQPQQPQYPQDQQGDGELAIRVDRLEQQLRQITGQLEQLQMQNQQLMQQLQQRGENPPPGPQQRPVQQRPPNLPQQQTTMPPPLQQQNVPPAGPQQQYQQNQPRRDVFDPDSDPNAPGRPRNLGQIPQQQQFPTQQPQGPQGPMVLTPNGNQNLPPPPDQNPGPQQQAVAPPTNSPKDAYDLAYGYVLRRDYALAEQSFRGFLDQYQGDRNVPLATYWLGESLYQQKKYNEAANIFLDIYKQYPQSQRAPDSLLRLGQTLAQLGNKEGACGSLGQVLSRYPKASANVKKNAEDEQKGSVADRAPVAESELPALFDDFSNSKKTLLAVSGGPDSTALLVLAAKWRASRSNGPELIAATIDHRLRAASKSEAKMAAKLAASFGVPHHTLAWTGKKPITGVQEAAREARFAMFSKLAKEIGADTLMTAHTRDDQAETVLHRMGRGSGIGGLAGIRRVHERGGIFLARPFLDLPKTRLIATLKKLRIPFASDPTNKDTKYLRARLRKLAPVLAKEGIDAANLALMAKRLARANAALHRLADEAAFALRADQDEGRAYQAREFFLMPEEIGVRILRETVDAEGHEGPAELAKVEALYDALVTSHLAGEDLKRTLAGALVTLSEAALVVAAAPPREISLRQGQKKARKA